MWLHLLTWLGLRPADLDLLTTRQIRAAVERANEMAKAAQEQAEGVHGG